MKRASERATGDATTDVDVIAVTFTPAGRRGSARGIAFYARVVLPGGIVIDALPVRASDRGHHSVAIPALTDARRRRRPAVGVVDAAAAVALEAIIVSELGHQPRAPGGVTR